MASETVTTMSTDLYLELINYLSSRFDEEGQKLLKQLQSEVSFKLRPRQEGGVICP